MQKLSAKMALFIAALISLPSATVLGTLAAQMQPGEWRVLNQRGDGSGFSDTLISVNNGHQILEYAAKMCWDPIKRKAYFIGQGHYSLQKFISYSDDNNRWSVEAKPYWDCSEQTASGGCIGHAYEHNAINPLTGDYYYGFYGWTRQPQKLSAATGTWSALPAAPSGKVVCCMAWEYFPEMGGLVLAGGGYAHFFNTVSNAWTTLSSGLSMGSYQSSLTYNASAKAVFFGGGNGSRSYYKADGQGRVTTLRNAPVNFGVTQAVLTCDPASGRTLLFPVEVNSFHEYNHQNDTWTSRSGASGLWNNTYGTSGGAIATPVSNYGVIMFITWNFENSKVLVYRHSAGTGVVSGKIPSARPISVSPNPFNRTVNIRMDGPCASLDIYSVDGALVKSFSGNAATWDARGCPAGVYLVKAWSDGKNLMTRVLLQK